MGVGRGGGQGEPRSPWNLKILAKVIFLVSSGKNKFHHFWRTPGKILEKSASGPPEKNPSDAHASYTER